MSSKEIYLFRSCKIVRILWLVFTSLFYSTNLARASVHCDYSDSGKHSVSSLSEPIKLCHEKHLPSLLSQKPDITYGVAQSINLGEVRGKVFELLTDQPLVNARVVLSNTGEEHKTLSN